MGSYTLYQGSTGGSAVPLRLYDGIDILDTFEARKHLLQQLLKDLVRQRGLAEPPLESPGVKGFRKAPKGSNER